MRIQGWSKLGYYPTPNRVTDLIAAQVPPISPSWNPHQKTTEFRLMDPCCGDGNAIARFTRHITDSLAYLQSANLHTPTAQAYGVELDRNRAASARRKIHQVWCADIDNVLISEKSYNILWLNPPYDWSEDVDHDGSRRLESRFLKQTTPGLTPDGLLIYIIPQHVLAWDAVYLARHYRDIKVMRFPDPEYAEYRQVVVIAQRAHSGARRVQPSDYARIADLATAGADLAPLPDSDDAHVTCMSSSRNALAASKPVRVMHYNPHEVVKHMNATGAWNMRDVQDLLSTQIDPVRLRPIEPLLDGHAAMVAANSMIDNILIEDPDRNLPSIVIRGFFRKVKRETFRSARTVKQTDFFESNIRALDVATGDIEDVGSSPDLLRDFMTKYGPSIHSHIASAYPPSIDTTSPLADVVRQRLQNVHRPLLGKQNHVVLAAAMHLSRNKHVNLFAQQGSGKTCSASAIARGLNASRIAVVTPARVVPNWIDEIRAISPKAIIRVVKDGSAIGVRRPPTPLELATPPAPFARTSLEEIRRLESWATPDTPLWVIFKKDSARTSYPVAMGLRWTQDPPRDSHRTPLRPLEPLNRAQRACHSQFGADTPEQPRPRSSYLYRDDSGALHKDDGFTPAGTCPHCWYPLTDHDKWNPRRRNALCLNERIDHHYPVNQQLIEHYREQDRATGRVAGKYGGTWLSMNNPAETRQPAASSRPALLPTTDDNPTPELAPHCRGYIATAIRTDTGRAVYSYGDYASKYMNRWFDLLVVDEAQDYKAKNTGQGQTVRRMTQRFQKTLFLTGTPFGGRVSEVFYLLLCSDPAFSKHFTYSQLGPFKRAYGREEFTIQMEHDEQDETVGLRSNRRQSRKDPREIPGYHPALLEHFWHNTLFMSLDDVDVDARLPTFTRFAELIPLDDTQQSVITNYGVHSISQRSGYQTLDSQMTSAVKRDLLQGQRRTLSRYLQETLSYPENCWQGARPEDAKGNTIVNLPPLDPDRLYPKEIRLMEIIRQQRDAGRKCLVYCTHTNRRDITTRLTDLLKQHDFKAIQLRSSTVNSEKRTAWLQQEANRNDVIITQPKLVETGVNLLEYPTIIWYEIDYSMFCNEQASARSYRINQTEPVEVYYLAYADTMQERALRVVARKSDVSRTFHGDLSKNGLSAFNPDPDDIREELARQLLSGQIRAPKGRIAFNDASGRPSKKTKPTRTKTAAAAAAGPPPPPRPEPARPAYSDASAVQTHMFEDLFGPS